MVFKGKNGLDIGSREVLQNLIPDVENNQANFPSFLDYTANGHGGNKELIVVMKIDLNYYCHFQCTF